MIVLRLIVVLSSCVEKQRLKLLKTFTAKEQSISQFIQEEGQQFQTKRIGSEEAITLSPGAA